VWKIYYETRTETGDSREDWDALPVTGVQVLMVKDPDRERSRVGYYQKDRDRLLFWDKDFYIWGPDDQPAGCTPDAVLDAWAQRTNDTSVRVGDLSMDDLHALGVKCGRSLVNEQFEAILDRALNDPEIP
jgi:hypothetical protein